LKQGGAWLRAILAYIIILLDIIYINA